MSVYSIERLRQILGLLEMKVVGPMIENSELCQQVERWLCDEASREAYRRELVFKPLYQLTRNEQLSVQLAGNMSMEYWKQALRAAVKGLEGGTIPDLDTGKCQGYWRQYLFASTYVLQQYQYGEQVKIQSGDTVLDCGGCFGDTAIWFVQKGAGKVYTFEPMPSNRDCMHKNIKKMQLGESIIPIPLALGQEPGELTFHDDEGNPAASHADAAGSVKAQVTTIDQWCAENQVKPTFIKMDIEGAEASAIVGGQNIIRECKPRLAICLYHQLSDMWTIPRLIKQICPEYRMWCRKNAVVGEFVLYGAV